MKHKGLYFVIALALGAFGAAHAQDASDTSSSAGYDSRWYVAPTIGGYYNDSKRNTDSTNVFGGIGFGRLLTPNFGIDIFADRVSRTRDGVLAPNGIRGPGQGQWPSTTLGVSARYYFGAPDSFRFFVSGGVMASYHNANDRQNSVSPYFPIPPKTSSGVSPAAQVGLGLQKSITENVDLRVEADYRYDWDGDTQPNRSGYGDYLLGFSVLAKLGSAPTPVTPTTTAPPPVTPDCSKMDSDGDGVNDCDDKCPNTPAGTIVGPDGCPKNIVIDLKGVNFKFDYPKKGHVDASEISKALAEPSAESISILDQAIDTLQRYPQVHVTVAGYTDSVGKPAYNQGLSERRAKIVYDYLTSHGIDASRLQGPIGHGENDPVADNKTADGRARNRRTELQVQQ